MRTLFDFEWRDEYLIFPAVKRAVSLLAWVTWWGYAVLALLWLSGLALLPVGAALYEAGCSTDGVEWAWLAVVLAGEVLNALLVPCLWVLLLWCHHVLLACRGIAATRWMLLFLLFFAFLHPVCVGYACLTGEPLMANQYLLPAVLYTVLASVVVLNWFHMAALPLRFRVLLLLFVVCSLSCYILSGSVLVLLLPCFSFSLLSRLASLAPLVAGLPPKT